MKQLYLKWCMLLVLLIVGLAQSSAQIVLHEATDITQTKATLSADFPDTSVEHGFQYKYGSLPIIDDFSKFALSELSDPVQLETNSLTGWTVRSAKGWIESKTSIPVGQPSSITANVTLYEDSEICFDWAVDSEDNIGTLSFIVDGTERGSISGLVEFTTICFSIPKGEHTLTWEYVKKRETNIGLDLARLKNIFIPNTTKDDWIEVSGNVVHIENLKPASTVLFRAFDNLDYFSRIDSFRTLDISLSNVSIQNITQTSAVIGGNHELGDFESSSYIGIVDIEYDEDSRLYALLSPKTYGIPIELTGYSNHAVNSNCLYGRNIGVYITLEQPTVISFEAYGQENQVARFYLDDYYDYNGLIIKSVENIVNEDDPELFTKYTFLVPAGKHLLGWNGGANGKWVGNVCVKNLEIPGIEKKFAATYPISNQSSFSLTIDKLLSDKVYSGIYSMSPLNKSNMNYDWEHCEKFQFATKKIIAYTTGVEDLRQASCNLTGSFDFGGANISLCGLKYRTVDGNWIDLPQEVNSHISSNISRLRPGTTYEFCCYAKAEKCDTVFSEYSTFRTLDVIPNIPLLIRLSQHEATLKGSISYGDASIYARGMQFRKKGISTWEEVEDGGNDSIYTLVKKNLEMGATYQARTYVQPAGCDILYSDILEFTTLETYFTKCYANDRTQTTITLVATLADVDEGVTVDSYGFEYFIDSDGFFENADSFVKSDVIDVNVTPNGNELKTVITGLAPYMGIRWRTYAKINGNKTYFTSYKDWEWDFAGTDRATIVATVKNITQTSISLELDATQEGDAIISQIEYALANSTQDTQSYSICGNTLTLENLIPNKQYNVRFRGLVNNLYCPLLKELSWDYSWFEYKTLPINVNVSFSAVTQTKAKMEVEFESGDANVSDIRYSLNYSDILPYTNGQLLTNLAPGSSYSITIYAKVNGEEMCWTKDASDNAFRFTTKSVSANVSIPETYQTAAKISWAVYVGDATFVGFGLEIGDKEVNSDRESGEQTFNELIPNRSYTCRSYVETVEGGRVYSTQKSFTTKAISTTTLNVSNISNRSATMNGEIDCDSYSSAEFGFQWKQMEDWQSAPAFTRGGKREDGEISVSLVNGMLEPNTDYQYRTAVRYLDEIYTSNDWKTFRTESEFIYYPATVYTVFRTDRENNALILCGYYIAGSETITSQGYEYWQVGQQSSRAYAPQNAVTITTDESMQHTFLNGELANGNYAVRAFVRTETGDVLYGATLGFNVSENGYSGIDTIDSDNVRVFAEGSTLKVVNGNNLSCYIYDLRGLLITKRDDMSEYEEFHLAKNAIYIVKLSNGKVMKLRL